MFDGKPFYRQNPNLGPTANMYQSDMEDNILQTSFDLDYKRPRCLKREAPEKN